MLAPSAVSECVHHWNLEPPLNDLSQGECRNCGAVKTFSNRVNLGWSETQGAVGFGVGVFAPSAPRVEISEEDSEDYE